MGMTDAAMGEKKCGKKGLTYEDYASMTGKAKLNEGGTYLRWDAAKCRH